MAGGRVRNVLDLVNDGLGRTGVECGENLGRSVEDVGGSELIGLSINSKMDNGMKNSLKGPKSLAMGSNGVGPPIGFENEMEGVGKMCVNFTDEGIGPPKEVKLR
ncbi:hypothetical protein LWI29_031166 [Acer saccharum]|uniref:Uncharacterized protein n=1 Tax=Acer saccharum TaxID=4024 RepID=A0AA39W766_ACESA|nr:hypothetical protein LWI29_031166 [Acer saccharum]